MPTAISYSMIRTLSVSQISVSEKNKTTRKEIGPLRLALTVVGFPEY
jgi:hypothetical protein